MSWAITKVGDHWVWTVWTPTERRTGFSGSEDLATRQAELHNRRCPQTSSVELPAQQDSAKQRTPGTPDSHDRKDCST